MATETWTGVFGGDWSDPTGWSGGTVPAAGDTVQLNQALNGPYTVHLDVNEGPYAALTLSVSGATMLSAGDIAIAANAALDTGTRAAPFSACRTAPWRSPVKRPSREADSAFIVAHCRRSLAFAGGSFGISGGHVAVTNQVTETTGAAGFYGGTFNAGSLAISGGNLGMSGGTLAASGALTLSGTGSIGIYNTAATLQAGSLRQTGGSLGMSGGTLAIAGQASFTGGTDVIYGGSSVNAGSFARGSMYFGEPSRQAWPTLRPL